jgi:ELWxxDGT repeat protein
MGIWAIAADGTAVLLRARDRPVEAFEEGGFGALASVGARAFFQELEDVAGARVWVTDGSREGTIPVVEVAHARPDGAGTDDQYFFWSRLEERLALFVTDGTETGTRLARDWPYSSYSYWPEFFASGGSRTYFSGEFPEAPLWSSDGTAEGTAPVILPSLVAPLLQEPYGWLGDELVFSTYPDRDLFADGGSARSPRPLNLPAPDLRPWRGPVTSLGDWLLFYVDDSDGIGYQIWRTDGSSLGTFQISDFQPWQVDDGFAPGFDAGGTAVFELESFCYSIPPSCYWSTFVTDGTAEGSGFVDETSRVFAGYEGSAAAVATGVLVAANDFSGDTGIELWRIEPADRSLHPVANLEPEIGRTRVEQVIGRPGGPILDLLFDLDLTLSSARSTPLPLPVYGQDAAEVQLILGDTVVAIGWEAWAGSRFLALNPDETGWIPLPLPVPNSPANVLTHLDEAFLLTESSPPVVWRTDGTELGTWAISIPGLSYREQLVAATETHLYFRAEAPRTNWYAAAREGGLLSLLLEETEPPSFRNDNETASIGELFYFTTNEAGSIERLHYSDGSLSGTGVVWSSSRDERVLDLFPVGDELYFLVASEELSLWRTLEGTEATKVADLGALAHDGDDLRPHEFVAFEDGLCFVAETAATGRELWCSDGAGTRVVELIAGSRGGEPRWLAKLGGGLLFSADDGVFGREVWAISDPGSEAILAGDIAPGAASSGPEHLVASGPAVYFSADDGSSGRELWVVESDGVSPRCQPSATRLCLLDGRFEAVVVWNEPSAWPRSARAVPLSTQSGLFWFFDEASVELGVKAIDACNVPGVDQIWLYAAGVTTLETRVTILDTLTLERQEFEAVPDEVFPSDSAALSAACDSTASSVNLAQRESAPWSCGAGGLSGGGESVLRLHGGRFEATLEWTSIADSGTGTATALSAESGFFTFFAPESLEAIVRVVDGCAFNGRYWLMVAGLTDVSTRLRVRDVLHPGIEVSVERPEGVTYPPLVDISAFATCP